MNTPGGFSEKRFGRLIQRTLQAGVAAAFCLVLAGWGLGLAGSPAAGRLLYAGIVALVLTPVARVGMLVYGFQRNGQPFFALASLVVLLLLLVSALL
ncbi:MAG: DUF1634 domain-containing protein [Elusimicrobia bacterium]|nr:DUF1634 domain-containing protein [Elusimicrobiota bacterium]